MRLFWFLLALVIGVATWVLTEFEPFAHTLVGSIATSTLGVLFGACLLRIVWPRSVAPVQRRGSDSPAIAPGTTGPGALKRQATTSPAETGGDQLRSFGFDVFVIATLGFAFFLTDQVFQGLLDEWWHVLPYAVEPVGTVASWILLVAGVVFVGFALFGFMMTKTVKTITWRDLLALLVVVGYVIVVVNLFSNQYNERFDDGVRRVLESVPF